MGDIFREAGSSKAGVLMYANDLFSQVKARSFRRLRARSPVGHLEVSWPSRPRTAPPVAVEGCETGHHRPDHGRRAALLPEILGNAGAMGIIGPGSRNCRGRPGGKLKSDLSLLDNVPGPPKPADQEIRRRVREAHRKTFDTAPSIPTTPCISRRTCGARQDDQARRRRRRDQQTQFTSALAVSVGGGVQRDRRQPQPGNRRSDLGEARRRLAPDAAERHSCNAPGDRVSLTMRAWVLGGVEAQGPSRFG